MKRKRGRQIPLMATEEEAEFLKLRAEDLRCSVAQYIRNHIYPHNLKKWIKMLNFKLGKNNINGGINDPRDSELPEETDMRLRPSVDRRAIPKDRET